MKTGNQLRTKILQRFDTLISEGESILGQSPSIPARYEWSQFSGQNVLTRDAYRDIDWAQFVEWRTKITTLLAQVVPKGHLHFPSLEIIPSLKCAEDQFTWAISFLKAIRNDLDAGFLDDLYAQIEAEVSCDYLGQAETLMKEGQSGRFDHVPAAVLAGAVLEKALRTLCGQQVPPISTVSPKAEPKTMNPLIDDLKKAGVFNELKAKQLRAWADIRNKAAHGEFDQFVRTDVEHMLSGISSFLATLH